MNSVKSILAILLVALSFVSNAQDNHNIPRRSGNLKLIAVVNRANWCAVCRANGERFGALITPHASKDINIYMNDLTNDTTKAASKSALEKANIYEAVTTIPRKGMGKLLQSCGLAKAKKQLSLPSGIVTFINPETHKQLKQLSVASSDEEMKTTIENFLKRAQL
jgi:hypothetical protein